MDKPKKKEWNQLEGREGKIKTDGFNEAYELWEKYHEESIEISREINKESINEIIKLNKKVEDLKNEHQDYYSLANVVDGFVDLKPEHPLYHSIRKDVQNYLKRLIGKKACIHFDGGCCCNEDAFPTGVPTEICGNSCINCKFYEPGE